MSWNFQNTKSQIWDIFSQIRWWTLLEWNKDGSAAVKVNQYQQSWKTVWSQLYTCYNSWKPAQGYVWEMCVWVWWGRKRSNRGLSSSIFDLTQDIGSRLVHASLFFTCEKREDWTIDADYTLVINSMENARDDNNINAVTVIHEFWKPKHTSRKV